MPALRAPSRNVLLTFFDQAAASIRIASSPSICDAASSGDCSLVQDYLALDPSWVHSREDGRCCPFTPLHALISTSHASHYPFDLISDHTPLHKSARNGHADLCQMLVLAGSDVNAKSILNMYSSIRARVFEAPPLTILFSCQRPRSSSRCRSKGLRQRVQVSRRCRCCCRCKRQRV